MKNRLAWSIRNAADDDHAEIKLYAEVGESWWFESVTAQEFTDELDQLDVSSITLRINSPGGSVFDGVAMYSALRSHRAKVTSVVEGLAASIASIVMLAGETVQISDAAMVMIHNPWGMAVGDATDMRKTAQTLDEIRDVMVGVYAKKTGRSTAEIVEALDAETWLSAQKALDFGIVDQVLGDGEEDTPDAGEAAARAVFDERVFSRFRHTPEQVVAAYRRGGDLVPALAAGAGPALDNSKALDAAHDALRVMRADAAHEGSGEGDAAPSGSKTVEAAADAGTINDNESRSTPEHAARVREILTTL
jgi:ATP-dependent Clp protease, protease subunit